MKLFKVYVDDWDWDDYDYAIVIAESEEQIRANIEQRAWGRVLSFNESHDVWDVWFDNWQGDIHIEEIKLDKIVEPKILLASFHSG